MREALAAKNGCIRERSKQMGFIEEKKIGWYD